MTSELPQAGRLRLERHPDQVGVWRIATPAHRFTLNPPYSRTVAELLVQHGAEVLEVGDVNYRAGSIAEGAHTTLAEIIAGFNAHAPSRDMSLDQPAGRFGAGVEHWDQTLGKWRVVEVLPKETPRDAVVRRFPHLQAVRLPTIDWSAPDAQAWLAKEYARTGIEPPQTYRDALSGRTAPDAAGPLSPGDGGPLHGGKELTADDDHKADILDAVVVLNNAADAARDAGLKVDIRADHVDGRSAAAAFIHPRREPPAEDADRAEARKIMSDRSHVTFEEATIAAIKRGRELAHGGKLGVLENGPKPGHPVEIGPGVWGVYAKVWGHPVRYYTGLDALVSWSGPPLMQVGGAAVFWDAEREAFNGSGIGTLMLGWEWRANNGDGLAVVWVP